MSSTFKHANNSPGFLLWKLTTEWQQKQRAALKPHGLTHVQFVYLACLQWLLSQTKIPITQNKIAQTSKIDKMVISETTKKLLKMTLIQRMQHPDDKRSTNIELTPKGQSVINKTLPIVEAIDKNFFTVYEMKIKRLAELASNITSTT